MTNIAGQPAGEFEAWVFANYSTRQILEALGQNIFDLENAFRKEYEVMLEARGVALDPNNNKMDQACSLIEAVSTLKASWRSEEGGYVLVLDSPYHGKSKEYRITWDEVSLTDPTGIATYAFQ